MHRRISSLIATVTLFAVAFGGFALSGAPSFAAAAKSGVGDDAQALKVAEMKLAALAKEVRGDVPPDAIPAPPGTPAPKPAAAKKRSHKAKKKQAKVAKSANTAGTMAPGAPQKILGRRLTHAEVQGILSTTRDFSGTDLSGMNLAGIDLREAKLNRANLQQANLERADLGEADLELADLSGADLRGASLNQARLRGTRLEGAKMDGALWIDKSICKKGSLGSCIE